MERSEDSLRSGTEPILAIAGFGQAAKLLEIKQISKLKALRIAFEKKVKKANLGIQIIGENSNRLPNTFMMYTWNKSRRFINSIRFRRF